jgi:hypothetical protein
MLWSAPRIWSQEECWIIGGGVSVADQFGVPKGLVPDKRPEFLEFGRYMASIHSKRVIGVNLSAFLGDWVDIAFWGDSDTYIDHRDWFDSLGAMKVTVHPKFESRKYGDVLYLKKFKSNKEALSLNPSELGWGFNSGLAAINLAIHLGAVKIYLLGFDMYKDEEVDRVHWHAGYFDKTRCPTRRQFLNGRRAPRVSRSAPFERQLSLYPVLAKECEKLGVEVINVSPRSAIEGFKKKALRDVIPYHPPIEMKSEVRKESPVNAEVEVRCLLKTGGPYNVDYVRRLKNAVENNSTLSHTFVCLTDDEGVDFCQTISLANK